MLMDLYIAIVTWRKLCRAQIFCCRKHTSCYPSRSNTYGAKATLSSGCCEPMPRHYMVNNVGSFMQVAS